MGEVLWLLAQGVYRNPDAGIPLFWIIIIIIAITVAIPVVMFLGFLVVSSIKGGPAHRQEADRRGEQRIQRFAAEHQDTHVPGDHVTADGFYLGNWVKRQRKLYRRGKLPARRIALLESLPGWEWGAVSA